MWSSGPHSSLYGRLSACPSRTPSPPRFVNARTVVLPRGIDEEDGLGALGLRRQRRGRLRWGRPLLLLRLGATLLLMLLALMLMRAGRRGSSSSRGSRRGVVLRLKVVLLLLLLTLSRRPIRRRRAHPCCAVALCSCMEREVV